MKSLNGIKSGFSEGISNHSIARKIYLSYPTEALIGQEDIEYSIKIEISEYFNVEFLAIQICGSTKTGISFFKDKKFEPGESDLDIAIISPLLYRQYLEISHDATNGFNELTKFPFIDGQRGDVQFFNNLKKGFFNPAVMPRCEERRQWFKFYNDLSNKYFNIFKNINAGIYMSEYMFEFKQKECIDIYLENEEKYDTISGEV